MKLTINILCLPCIKCKNLKSNVERALRITETEATVTQITNFADFAKYSINVSQTPILVINDRVEFAGQVAPTDVLCKRITEVKTGGTVF